MPVEQLKLRAEKRQKPFASPAPVLKKNSVRLAGFISAVIALAACFSFPLCKLLGLAVTDSLYSDIFLIPLISLYLLWMQREKLPHFFETALKSAATFFAAGLLTIAVGWIASRGSFWTSENCLSLNIFALLLFFTAICFLFLGELFVRAAAFPLALLIFTIPLPAALRHWIETFLQHGSAASAGFFFQLSGTPVLQDGLDFRLPGCILQVAPECSGIHSTLVLVITSLIGGWLFLRSPWNRAVLALFVIPLALIRNGFRIFVIGRLCADYGPQMLASPIHRHGGPLFFTLSLIPLFLFMLFLRKTENTNHPPLTKRSL